MKTCTMPECERPLRSLGYCDLHYQRARRGQDMTAPPLRAAPVAERLMRKVRVASDGACWVWTGHVTPDGYGQIGTIGRRLDYAHRVSYEVHVGPIPSGLQIDHRCHTDALDCLGGKACAHRRCVNPAHLEPVTQAENLRRGRASREARMQAAIA